MARAKKTTTGEGVHCPKCGSTKGWTGPTYRAASHDTQRDAQRPNTFAVTHVFSPECLVYTCDHCGYTRHEPCIDASIKGETSHE